MSDNLALDRAVLARIAGQNCAVAVSGGSDSLALLHLLHAAGIAPLTAITVNHHLREEAAAEAHYVKEVCTILGVRHEILDVKPDRGNLQAEARRARYAAMEEYCRAQNIPFLLLGHSFDDQIETFFLNALRGSGVDGLAAMPLQKSKEPALLRPMLGLRRKDLQAYLDAHGIAYVSDPSNEDQRFERVKMRQWIAGLEADGAQMAGLANTIKNMQRSRDFLQFEGAALAQELLEFAPLHIEAKIEREALLEAPKELALRMMARLCQFYGGSVYKPRFSSLMRLYEALQNRQGGQTIEKTDWHWGARFVRVYAEISHLPAATHTRIWGRYNYHGVQDFDMIGALGEHASGFEARKEWGISAKAAQGLPVIYQESRPNLASIYQFESSSFHLLP